MEKCHCKECDFTGAEFVCDWCGHGIEDGDICVECAYYCEVEEAFQATLQKGSL